MKIAKLLGAVGVMAMAGSPFAVADSTTYPMGFFVTSVGMGDGANLGGLDGADAYCTKLAEGAGTTGRTWHAYLSTQEEGKRGVSARSRIGAGPWYNSRSELIAVNVETLHLNPNIDRRTALDENGKYVNGRENKPNEHDILTGSMADGTAYFPWEKGDKTCSNWTSNGEGSATVGHHDRNGGGNTSWNSAHGSRGCSQDNLKSTGGAGMLYCFAAD